ncbi:hypothetical protein HW555_001793 [Spodoptera exigua]|uniref:Uncharacterized protein n=1 Tax=Spodoptera exigua TaxID=7107 RepID=A0A835GPD5_SPOEX|nr:hypothetical protein HW555_001793 [Spodoptera exigua]
MFVRTMWGFHGFSNSQLSLQLLAALTVEQNGISRIGSESDDHTLAFLYTVKPLYGTANEILSKNTLDYPLIQTYMVHSALLVVKLLALSPIAAMTWVRKGVFSNPDIVRRAYLSELKNLAPFWIVGGLYVTTNPPSDIAISLFRMFTAARMIVILQYASKPVPVVLTDFETQTNELRNISEHFNNKQNANEDHETIVPFHFSGRSDMSKKELLSTNIRSNRFQPKHNKKGYDCVKYI